MARQEKNMGIRLHLEDIKKSPMVSYSCERREKPCCPLRRQWDLTRGRLEASFIIHNLEVIIKSFAST